MVKPFDDLEEFKNWWLNHRPINTFEGSKPDFHSSISSTILYRQHPYQVQLFIAPPHTVVDDHIHPNVDSFEVYLSGDIVFSHTGVSEPNPVFGMTIRVRKNDWHGGRCGKMGGTFLSVQKWDDGTPQSSIGNNWHDHGDNKEGNDKNTVTTAT